MVERAATWGGMGVAMPVVLYEMADNKLTGSLNWAGRIGSVLAILAIAAIFVRLVVPVARPAGRLRYRQPRRREGRALIG